MLEEHQQWNWNSRFGGRTAVAARDKAPVGYPYHLSVLFTIW